MIGAKGMPGRGGMPLQSSGGFDPSQFGHEEQNPWGAPPSFSGAGLGGGNPLTSNAGNYASGAGAIGSGLFDLFGHHDDPSKKAANFYDQIPDQLRKYLEPYFNNGQNPGDFLKKIGAGYQESPGFQFAKKQGLGSIENAAAAGGMLGTQGHQQQAGELSTNLANQDYNSYLQNALGVYNTGANAGGNLAQNLAQFLMSRGNLAYEGAAGNNRRKSNGLESLFGGIASLLPWGKKL